MNAVSALILIHYYITPDDYKNPCDYSDSDKQALKFLQRENLINENHDITPRGRCLVTHWLSTNLPSPTWEVICG